MILARSSTSPCVDTLGHPRTYSPRQLYQAVLIAQQATDTLGGRHGFVCGEMHGVLGVYGDRGVLVLCERPEGE